MTRSIDFSFIDYNCPPGIRRPLSPWQRRQSKTCACVYVCVCLSCASIYQELGARSGHVDRSIVVKLKFNFLFSDRYISFFDNRWSYRVHLSSFPFFIPLIGISNCASWIRPSHCYRARGPFQGSLYSVKWSRERFTLAQLLYPHDQQHHTLENIQVALRPMPLTTRHVANEMINSDFSCTPCMSPWLFIYGKETTVFALGITTNSNKLTVVWDHRC